MKHQPVTSLEVLDSLDQAEMVEGYHDGLDGNPEPGDNRSLSYWHGWRNGAADGGHIEIDDSMRCLAYKVVNRGRQTSSVCLDQAENKSRCYAALIA